ncbi:MAG: hypothetical protein JO345_07815 [Streptosporangiaceae bacterium]|nr:hypothetical protein [Streptosporangiaceae bacterium]
MPDPVEDSADPVVSACFGLGWRIEELFNQFDVPARSPRPYDMARLAGLSRLNSYDWQRLGLDQADFVLSQVRAAVGAPSAIPVDITADARAKLDATIQEGEGSAGRRGEYRAALATLHVNLLIVLTAAGPYYGKAYGLGRALADTTRPHQSRDEFAGSFQQDRIGQLYVWLDELASRFPEHAARSVAQSLDWWGQATTAAVSGSKMSADAVPTDRVVDASGQPRKFPLVRRSVPVRSARTRSAGIEPPPMDALTAAVARQGGIWRRVLTGEKRCTDMLTPQDYLRAGERLATHYTTMAHQAVRSFLPWLLMLLLALAAVVIVLVLVPGSAVARTATAAAAAAGALSGTWKIIGIRVAPIAAQLTKPLWGGELDTATAEAITVPPVGTPQAQELETALAEAAADVITSITQPTPDQS